jgi:cytochrome c553
MKKILISLMTLPLLAACGKDEAPAPPAVDVAAGRALVENQCTGCHTPEGGGRTAEIPNLAGQPAAYLAEAMHAYRDGRRHHAALKDLIAAYSEEDIRNIAAYFAGLPRVVATPPDDEPGAVYREGEEVAAACIACHGEDGFSTTPGVPNLAGQHPMYLIVATQEYANGERDNAEKEAMLKGLGNVDIEKMAMYFAAQAPEPRDPPPFGDPVAGEAQTALCGGCHGARGVSDDPMVPNLAGQEPNYLVKAIKAYRDKERSHEDMVADKTDAEIEDIAAFYSIQSAGPVTASGEQTAEIIAKCDRCHGHAVGESTMVVPVLRGQKQEYLLRVMQEYRDAERGNSMMHKMSAGYSDRVLAEIAEYYATHSQPD